MHELLEILGHVVRFGVAVAATGCGLALGIRFSFQPRSLPLTLGLLGFGIGDFITLAMGVFDLWTLPTMHLIVPVFFILASVLVLVGLKPIGACYAELDDAD